MKIKSITRTISGDNYDNISATAEIEEGEDCIAVASELDGKVRTMLKVINERNLQKVYIEKEKEKTICILEDAIEFIKKHDPELPF